MDFRISNADFRRALAQRFRTSGIQLIAEKVETQAELNEARSLGYTFFQGYFFCKPAMVSTRDIPGSKLNYIRLLQAVSSSEISLDDVETLLKQDPAMVYKLLRYLNSPLLGLCEVRSVRHAMTLLGELEFRRWVSIVVIVAMASDKPPELIRTALTRAFFCEEISRTIGMIPESPNLFLMGLLSVTDAILDRPSGNPGHPAGLLRSAHRVMWRRQSLPGHLRHPPRLRTRRLGRPGFRHQPYRPRRSRHPRLLPIRRSSRHSVAS